MVKLLKAMNYLNYLVTTQSVKFVKFIALEKLLGLGTMKVRSMLVITTGYYMRTA